MNAMNAISPTVLADLRRGDLALLRALLAGRTRGPALTALLDALVQASTWGLDGPPGATGVLSGRGGRKRGPLTRSNFEVIHLIQGCHCALLQKLCKMPKSQTLDP